MTGSDAACRVAEPRSPYRRLVIFRVAYLITAVLVPAALSAQDHPDAPTAASGQYSVEFENDIVRILRVEYESGEVSEMHAHPAYCALTVASSGETEFTLPDGTVEEGMGRVDPGTLSCVDAEAHSVEYSGEGPLHVILVEFKGRESAM